MHRILLIATLGCGATSLFGQERPVTGRYMEDRSSRVYGCPCEWASEFVSAGREAVLAWDIESGGFAGQDLAGLRMAAVLSSDFSLSAPASLRRSAIFLDKPASDARRKAGEAWLRTRYGDVLGRVIGVHVVPVGLEFADGAVRLAIPGVVRVDMRRAEFARDTQSWAALLYDPLIRLESATLATTLHTQFWGTDLRIRWSREEAAITGYYGKFGGGTPD